MIYYIPKRNEIAIVERYFIGTYVGFQPSSWGYRTQTKMETRKKLETILNLLDKEGAVKLDDK